MNIRYNGQVYPVIENHPTSQFYIVRGALPDRDVVERLALLKTACEVVPDERWRDVTDAVEVRKYEQIGAVGIRHHGVDVTEQEHGRDYRLVKRSLWDCLPARFQHYFRLYGTSWDVYEAHIDTLQHIQVLQVERKVNN